MSTISNATITAFLAILTALGVGGGGTSQLAAISGAGSGLVAHYTFDEGSGTTAGDSAGSNTGTLTNGPTWTSGKIGSGAVSLNGSSYISAQSGIIGTTAATACAWIYPTAFTGMNISLVDNHYFSFYIYNDTTNNRLYLKLSNDGSGNGASSVMNAISANQWQHVCATRDSSGLSNIYVNASLSGSADQSGGVPSGSPYPTLIGAYPGGSASGFFNGSIDDVRIYSRALSSSEITEIYNYTGSGGGTLTNGVCSTSNNICSSGSSSDQTDSSTQYLWQCLGSGGGTTASCSLTIPTSPVSGICGSSNNVCTAGSLSDTSDTSTLYQWQCLGLNGGSTASCSQTIPTSTYTLSTTKSGTGSGTVTGGSINCGSTCSQSSILSGTSITLTATPQSGSTFTGWSGGGCSGTGSCTTTVTNNTTVTAGFNSSSSVVGVVMASTCSLANVQTAINTANNGDTVIIPNGTCTWESGITTSKQIKIQGQTKGSVKLVMGAGINSYDTAMLHVTTGTSYSTEISDIQFWDGGSGRGAYILLDGAESDKPPLIHDNVFTSGNNLSFFEFIIYRRYGGGVIYKNTFQSIHNLDTQNIGRGSIQVKDINGSASWATPSTMGTFDTSGLNNVYIEENTFNNIVSIDSDDSSRIVFRNNILNNSPMASHGADTSPVGLRHTEIYDNQLIFNSSGTWTLNDINGNPVNGSYPLNIVRWYDSRGGTGVITGNVVPNLLSQDWGDKAELALQIQQIDRLAGPDACVSTYPAFHQVGRGMNNTSEPLYVWGNTGTGLPESPSIERSGYNQCPGNPNQTNPGFYIQLNRDFYVGIAKPNWTRYPYPHPLRTGGSTVVTPPVTPPSTTYTLTVSKSGTGSGTVTGGSISCGSTCTQSSISSGTSITLTATPSTGSTFTGWSGGGCSGTGTCSTTVSANTTVTATFSTSVSSGTTINCDQASLQTAINNAVDGDTIACNAGTWTWTSPVVMSTPKAFTLQGAGMDQTIIIDNLNKASGINGTALVINTALGKKFRLTGMTFRGLAQDVNVYNMGTINIQGDNHEFRIDNIKFDKPGTSAIRYRGDLWGVVDNNYFDGSNYRQGNVVNGSGYGDQSFADPLSLGTEKAIYFEDNTFIGPGVAGAGPVDAYAGGRIVFRYNTVINDVLPSHGNETSGRLRGIRSYEVYNNTFTANTLMFTAIFLRGGTGVVFNNTTASSVGGETGYKTLYLMNNYRTTDDRGYVFGFCTGANPWDGNQNLSGYSAGYPCLDQLGRGQGDLVVGDSAITNSVTGTASWPRQQLEPLYAWNNTWTPVPNNPGSLYGISAPTVIKLGTDFYDGIAKPGYTPYVYPHPLRSGSSVVVPPVVTPTPDTTLPTVSITTPSNNSSVSGSVSISATASDNIGVIGVQWKLDGANLGSELTTAPYSGTWNTIGVSNGTHTLTATARDLAGNTKVSSTITLAISNTTPVTTTPSTGGSTGGGSTSGGTTSGGGGTSTTGTFTPTVTQKPAITTATTCKATNDLGRIIELFISLGIIKPDKVSSARTYLCSLSQPTTNNSQLTTGQRFTLALDLGSRNAEVTRLQTYLISQKLLSTTATGYYGPATAKAVGLFQQKYNLSTPGSSSYGFVGPKTRAKLNELVR